MTDPNRRDVEVVRDSVAGGEAWRISYVRKSGMQVRLWISEELGDSLVRVELDKPADGKNGRQFVTYVVEPRRHEGDVWFPKRIEYKFVLGDKTVDHEVVDVTAARFNFDVPDSAFSVAALGMHPGTLYNTHETETPTPTQVWDGKGFRPYTPTVARPDGIPAAMEPQARPRFVTYFAVANVLAAVALLLFYLYRRSKRNAAPPPPAGN